MNKIKFTIVILEMLFLINIALGREKISEYNTLITIPQSCTYTRKFDSKISRAIAHGDKTLATTRLQILNAEHNNLGVNIFHFPNKDLIVYRSSILTGNIRCLKELIEISGVRYIIYLKNDSTDHHFNFIEPEHIREKRYFDQLVLDKENNQYIIIDFVNRKIKSIEEKQEMIKRVSEIIHLIYGLDAPILIHCLGGEHKTGIIYGIMQKCINKMPIDQVIHEYELRTGKMKKISGGSRKEDVDFIKEFPCDMICTFTK